MRFFGCLFLILLAATIGCGDEALEDPLEEEVAVSETEVADQSPSELSQSFLDIQEGRERRAAEERAAKIAALEDPVALRKAKLLVDEVNRRRIEAYQAAKAKNDFSTIIETSDTIFKEVLGFEKDFWRQLVNTYEYSILQQGPEDAINNLEKLEELASHKRREGLYEEWYMEYMTYFDDLVVAWVMKSIMHPDLREPLVHREFSWYVSVGGAAICFPDFDSIPGFAKEEAE